MSLRAVDRLVAASIICPLLMWNGQAHFLPFMEHPLLKPWLHAARPAFAVCMVVLAAASLMTRPTAPERLATTIVHSLASLNAGTGMPLARDYRLWLGAIVAAVSVLWFLMR